MAETIPNLWSEDISNDVLPPLAILHAQAGLLSEITKGLVEAEVITEYDSTVEDGSIQNVQHHVELTAPALNAARYRILTVYHKRELVYPASVEAECFEPSDYDDYESFSWPEALREEDFLKIMKTTLRSKKVTSLIHSLIARSNEQRYLAGRPAADVSAKKAGPQA